MSIDRTIRESQRMHSLLDSIAVSSQIQALADTSSILRDIDKHLVANIGDQFSSAVKLLSSSVVQLELMSPAVDIARINEMLKPSFDFAKQFKEISAPLSSLQTDFLKNISSSQFQNVLNQLTLDSVIVGEFEIDSYDEESSESDSSDDSSDDFSDDFSDDSSDDSSDSSAYSSESSDSTLLILDLVDEVHQRLETVQFLPVALLDAIAENPELMIGMDPRDFEKLVAQLLESLEFENIILTPRSGDGGRDVIATKFIAGIPLLFSFECKRYSNKIGLDIMRGLLGSVAHGPTKVNKGVLVTTSSFTSGAEEFIVSEPLVDGKDFNDLVSWLNVYKNA